MLLETEGRHLSEWLKWEEENFYSREQVVVAQSGVLDHGTVVGKITASGKVVQLDPAASDGSEDAYGILYGKVDATGGDVPGVVIVREALVDFAKVIWPTGITAAQKTAAIAALNAKGIYQA